MRQLVRLLRYVRPYFPQLIVSVILMAGVGLLDGFRVLLIGPVLDRVLNPASQSANIVLFRLPGSHKAVYLQQFVPQHFHNAWTIVAFALVMSTFLKGVFDYVGTYLTNYAGYGGITDLRVHLYESVLRRSAAFFSRHSTATLLSTIINDVERVQYAMSSVLAEFLQQIFTFMATICVVIVLGGKLALVLLVFVPFVILSAGKIGSKVRRTTRRGQDKLAEVQNILHETITGNRIVKAFGMERWESMRFRAASSRLFKANLRSVRAQAVSSPLMDLIGAIAIAMLLLLGRDRINHGVFTTGQFVAFIIAVFKLYDPVRKFALFNNNFQQALGASQEVFKFMDAEDDVKDSPAAKPMKPFHDSIRFEHVNFGYDEAGSNGDGAGERREVLHDINLQVRRGEVLAIVGSSGAGKSTLVHLIPRFFDVITGRILIDGRDIREISLASLRSQIGIVTQDTILFNDTVRNNIAYGQPHIADAQVVVAAKAAMAHDFIMGMPDGYNSMIGERGLQISGGERQRLAIARAIFKNAPILILDEATSALDAESEALVQSALHNLMLGRTVFVIAHRLSTVRRADRIIVLENGAIADSGTHDDLLGRLGTYRRLYDLQFLDLDTGKVLAK
jgi:subfamily B ATP-binding cassette protein MsbA